MPGQHGHPRGGGGRGRGRGRGGHSHSHSTQAAHPKAQFQPGGGDSTAGSGGSSKPQFRKGPITVEDIQSDEILKLANMYWRGEKTKPYTAKVSAMPSSMSM